MSIRVILVDDYVILREGLRVLLERSSGIEVVGQVGDGRTAIALARKQRPTVVMVKSYRCCQLIPRCSSRASSSSVFH